VDESYTPDFPRAGQDYAYAAVIVPENQVEEIGVRLEEILRRIFPKEQSKELKYSELWRDPISRERVGAMVVQQLLLDIPGLAVLGLYVTRDGFFNERIRSLRAMREDEKTGPTPEEIAEITSSARIDEAVRTGAQNLALTVACGCASYVVGQGGRGEILFDPIEAKKDAILSRELESVLPLMPAQVPVIRHGDALVTLWPTPGMERIGDRLSICSSPPESKNCPGLQLADFCAGDIRRFFSENPTLLTASITEDIIVNKRVIFPQFFQVKQMPRAVMEAFRSRRGKSFLPSYVAVLARGLISYYTTNGHMRNLHIPTGNVFDIVD
jgi:hypothetical protein